LATLNLDEIGRRMGEELVNGGDQTPVSDALTPVLVQDQLGGTATPADALIIAQTAVIGDGPTRRFVNGLYQGLAGGGVPAVAIERTDERPTRIETYKSHRLSTVDSVDTTLGRVGLAALLSGGQPGQYGLKATATDGVTPVIDPLPLAPVAGG
jgi:Copper transport outer membrane protein, MctB